MKKAIASTPYALTRNLIHDLRTPLAVMRAELDLASNSETLTSQEMAALMQSNLMEIGHLTRILENFASRKAA